MIEKYATKLSLEEEKLYQKENLIRYTMNMTNIL